MKTKFSYSKFITAGLVSTSLFLSACQNDGQGVVGRQAGADAAGQPNFGKSELTPEQKNLVKDITTSPYYKNHLGTLLKSLTRENGTDFEKLAQLKTWVVGPQDLSKLTPELSTTSRGKGLVAKQRQHEIYIDSNSMEKLDAAAQAEVMKLEFLTSLYLLKSLKPIELCDSVREKFPETGEECEDSLTEQSTSEEVSRPTGARADTANTDAAEMEKVEKLAEEYTEEQIAASEASPLAASDTSNILNVLKYLQENAETLTPGKLKSVMAESGFNMRIFKIKIKGQAKIEVTKDMSAAANNTLDADDVENIFAELATLNDKEATCLGLSLSSTAKCKFKVQRTEIEATEGRAAKMAMSFSIVDEQSNVVVQADIHQPKVLRYTRAQGTEAEQTIQILPLTNFDMADKTVGAQYRVNYLIISTTTAGSSDGTTTGAQIEGLLSIPGKLTIVRDSKLTSKEACVGEKLAATNLMTDTIFASIKGSSFPVLTQMSKTANPLPPCW